MNRSLPTFRIDEFRFAMLTGDRCFMGAPLGDDHRCYGTVNDDQHNYLCPTCLASEAGSPACGCPGCSLPFGSETA